MAPLLARPPGREPLKAHLERYAGWMRADDGAGFRALCRKGAVRGVACLAHVRRRFVDVHRAQGSALAEEAIRRIAELCAVEMAIRGSLPDERARIRQDQAAPVLDELEGSLGAPLPTLSARSPMASAERAVRAIALGRRNHLFVGSPAGGRAAAIAYTPMETARPPGADPEARLADTPARIPPRARDRR